LIIARPGPSKWQSIGFTHPVPSIIQIHMGKGKDRWHHKESSGGVEQHLYQQRPVIQWFFLVVNNVNASSRRGKEALGRLNHYQCGPISSS
jgi:hypothetical protein